MQGNKYKKKLQNIYSSIPQFTVQWVLIKAIRNRIWKLDDEEEIVVKEKYYQ